MPDRETVIKGMELCVSQYECSPDDCPYYIRPNNESGLCWDRLMTDALALLKEQNAVKPILRREGRNKNYNDYECPRCDNEVVYEQNYCSECGVQFLWEDR